jgi:hypothetical protein
MSSVVAQGDTRRRGCGRISLVVVTSAVAMVIGRKRRLDSSVGGRLGVLAVGGDKRRGRLQLGLLGVQKIGLRRN